MHLRKKMRRLAALLILMTCTMLSCGAENNLTMAEVPVEVPITADDDSEQELSSQLQEVDSRSGGWSSWSNWSACSRSCDGGVSHQLRTCRTGACRGDHVRYKICNMQCLAVFVAIVAVANASVVGLGLGHGAVDSAAVVAGPSGTVTRSGVVAGPAVVAANGLALGLGAHGLGLGLGGLGLGGLGLVPAGSGLEGQWIPDINEHLYDDGSYKPHVYGW